MDILNGLNIKGKIDQQYSGTGTTGSPAATVSVLIGADDGATTRTNSTLKTARVGLAHYNNSEEPMAVLFMQSNSSNSNLHIGGGSTLMNAVNQLSFWVASNTTTTTGTEALRITSNGAILIGRSSESTNPKLQVGFTNPVASPAYVAGVDISAFNALGSGLIHVQAPTLSGYGFSSDTVRGAGMIAYTHSTNQMEFRTNATAKMWLTTDGTLELQKHRWRTIGQSTVWEATAGNTGAGTLIIRTGDTDTAGGALVLADLYTSNVLIGTSVDNGVDKLQVTGKIKTTDNINCNDKVKLTPEGGVAIRLTNKTGGASVKGHVVTVYTATAIDNAVSKSVNDTPTGIGVIYEAGIADGSEMWVVVSGIADVYFGGSTNRGNLARTTMTGDAFTTSGYAISEAAPSPPFGTDKHFCEIGHVLASRTGEGLAKVNLHFN